MTTRMKTLLKFLELVQHELGADDVRAEIGGRAPKGGVWGKTPSGIRIVVHFDAPAEDLEGKQAKLKALIDSFTTIEKVELDEPIRTARTAHHELEDALELLAHRARAVAALVIDESSPEIWGTSLGSLGPQNMSESARLSAFADTFWNLDLNPLEWITKDGSEIEDLLRSHSVGAAEAQARARDAERIRELGPRSRSRAHLLSSCAVTRIRRAEQDEIEDDGRVRYLVRPFASIYRLLLVFDDSFSALHAESALIRALPIIERLVTTLPPRDPASGGAKVAVLRRLRKV